MFFFARKIDNGPDESRGGTRMELDRAVFLDVRTVDTGDLDLNRLRETAGHWSFHDYTRPAETPECIAGARLVVSNKVVLDRPVLERAPHLRLICVAATGTNNVDLDAARDLGIAVTNVTAYATPAVVQHVFALILALSTRFEDYRAAVARGDWQRAPAFCLLDHSIREIAGLTLGIVGYGELGRGVARVAEAFGMRVEVAQRPGGEPTPGRMALDNLLRCADVVSLHVPLADNTRHLIGEPAGCVCHLSHDAESPVTGKHVQGVGGCGLHAASGDAVDQRRLLLHRNAGRVKHEPSLGHLGQHLGGQRVQFVEHVSPAALAIGSLENRLRVNPRDLLRGGIERVNVAGCCIGHG